MSSCGVLMAPPHRITSFRAVIVIGATLRLSWRYATSHAAAREAREEHIETELAAFETQ